MTNIKNLTHDYALTTPSWNGESERMYSTEDFHWTFAINGGNQQEHKRNKQL